MNLSLEVKRMKPHTMVEEFPVSRGVRTRESEQYSTSEMTHRSRTVSVGVCAIKTRRRLLRVTHSDARFSMLKPSTDC